MSLVSTPDNPPPPNGVEEAIRAVDGVQLRTVRWEAVSGARGAVVILGGRGEFIEKYFEVASDLLARGFSVALMDWRGQGGSSRLLRNAKKGHVDDFCDYQRDLDALAGSILAPHCPRPWYGLCHSMGAAALLLAAAAGRCPFDRLVLTSPMIAVKGLDHSGPKRLLTEGLEALGLGGLFAPRGGGPDTIWLGPFMGNVLTSDPARYARIARVCAAAPEIWLGGPTIGWVSAAFRAMRRFEEPNFAAGITTPTLIVASGADRIVDVAAAERFAARMPAGRIVVIDGAEHEILIERDVFRDQFWAAFDAFVPGSETNLRALAAAG